MRKATTYIVIDGEEIELEQVSDEQLKELGLDGLRQSAERKAQSIVGSATAPTNEET